MTFNQYQELTQRTRPTPEQNFAAAARLTNLKTIDLLHAAIGLVTEAAEIADILKKHLWYGKPIDDVHVIEELGDSAWYSALALAAMKKRVTDILEPNIAKLKARYPDGFSEEKALNRNLSEERNVLENGGFPLTDAQKQAIDEVTKQIAENIDVELKKGEVE